MASIEVRISSALGSPLTLQSGSEIKGRILGKIDTDREVWISAYFSPDKKSGTVNAEILGTEPRFKLGPIKLMEKKTLLDNITTTVRKRQTKGVSLATNQESDCGWMFIKYKTGKTNNSSL